MWRTRALVRLCRNPIPEEGCCKAMKPDMGRLTYIATVASVPYSQCNLAAQWIPCVSASRQIVYVSKAVFREAENR